MKMIDWTMIYDDDVVEEWRAGVTDNVGNASCGCIANFGIRCVASIDSYVEGI